MIACKPALAIVPACYKAVEDVRRKLNDRKSWASLMRLGPLVEKGSVVSS